MSAYKHEKEAFVSNLHGTTMGEVTLVALTIPVSYLLHSVVQSVSARSGLGVPLQFGLDFACLVLPLLATFNVPESVPYVFAVALLLCVVLDFYSRWRYNVSCFIFNARGDDPAPTLMGKHKPFLSVYRTAMMLCTCIAILAVDFPIFPRRFAKTETYGTSLMDMGVGSFVLSNALVYRPGSSTPGQQRRSSGRFGALVPVLLRIAPLLALGFIRLLTVKATDYQEHVSEYGVHWNFFFTLAAVSILAALLCPDESSPAALIGLVLTLGYQAALSLGGLREYILDAPRDNLVSQNREGLFSSLGYMALFMLGAELGRRLVLRDCSTRAEGWKMATHLAGLDVILWCLTAAASTFIELPSRRMMNLTYVLSTLAQNVLTLALLVLVSLLVRPPLPTPPSSRASRGSTSTKTEWTQGVLVPSINRNQLFIFLAANLMVGLVNFSIKTLYAGDALALAVLTAYMMAVCGLAAVLHVCGLTLKFW